MPQIVCGECGYRFSFYFGITEDLYCPVCGQLYLLMDERIYKAELMLEVE